MANPAQARHPLIALDLMRALAPVLVLICRLRGDYFVEYRAWPASQHNLLTMLFFAVTREGYEAVVIFFVLSGLLVGGQVLASVRQHTFQIHGRALICEKPNSFKAR